MNNKVYRVFNLKSLVMEESMNVVAFDKSKPPSKYKDLVDEEIVELNSSIENMDPLK